MSKIRVTQTLANESWLFFFFENQCFFFFYTFQNICHEDASPLKSESPWGSPGKNTGMGCCPALGDLSDPGIKPSSLKSPALGGRLFTTSTTCYGFPGGSDGKESVCNAGDPRLIPGSEISPGEGNGNSVQYSCLDNPMDRDAWQATVRRVTKSWTQLSNRCC